jgi:L-amino acid N-acyltransferase YncA
MEVAISKMSAEDWEAVRSIFQDGIATGQATFETEVPSWTAWDRARHTDCRLVARHGSQVVGWAALSPVSSRVVYAGVAEVSIYIAQDARGRGVGRALLQALVESSEDAGVWTLQASMFPENEVSIGLFEACGFRVVGVRERIARHYGVWRNTVLMERRSTRTGVQ